MSSRTIWLAPIVAQQHSAFCVGAGPLNVHTRWDDPAHDDVCVSWAREFFERSAPFATGGVYGNFMPGDEREPGDLVPS